MTAPGKPVWRPDELLGAKHDTPDQTGALVDFELITPGPDSFGSPDGRTYSTPETAGQAHVGRAWDEWYAENGRDRTMMQGFAESKYDAMRRAFHAGAIAAAAPAPAGEAVLPKVHAHPQDEADKWLAEMWEEDDANAVGYHRSDMVDAYHAGWRRARELTADAIEREQPQAAPGPDADPRPASMLQPVSFSDDDDPGELRKLVPAEQLDHARAEAAGIRAAAANTARELAEARERITDLAEQVTASAKATEPSRKSQIEHEIAIELRKLLEDQ